MPVESPLQQQMLAAIPHLRAFAISLTGDLDRSDDLVQGALLTGIDKIDQFRPGTSMRAWLFTILRNRFFTEHRRRKREVEDPEGVWAQKLAVLPEQGAGLELSDFQKALDKLPVAHREALLLVTAEGLSYEEAARICGTNIGTIKSRISRARTQLARLLAVDGDDSLGPNHPMRSAAVMQPWL